MNQRLTSYFGLLFADSKESILRLLAQLIIFCGAMGISLPGIQTRAAELPTIEVGLPEDGLFGLGGQYIIDKGLDRKEWLRDETPLGRRAGDPATARHSGAIRGIDDA